MRASEARHILADLLTLSSKQAPGTALVKPNTAPAPPTAAFGALSISHATAGVSAAACRVMDVGLESFESLGPIPGLQVLQPGCNSESERRVLAVRTASLCCGQDSRRSVCRAEMASLDIKA